MKEFLLKKRSRHLYRIIQSKAFFFYHSGNFIQTIRVITIEQPANTDELEIKEVIEHCKRGNQVAQGLLFNTYYRQMYNLSMRIISNHHDVEDVLILSFLKVFDNIPRFEYREEYSLKKWIKTIVINESIRFINARNIISYEDDLSEYEMNMISDTDLSIIDVDLVYSIIETMPAGYRVVFNLFAIEGYTHKEISELLNITENTSKSQLRKARINIIERINKTRKYGNS